MTGTPQSPPPSAGKLEKLVIAYAMRDGLAVARVRRWVSFMMLGGALDRAATRPGGARFVLKGGVALELRMRGRSRATEDLDVEAQSTEAELVTALDVALRDPYQDFSFSRRTAARRLGPRAERVEIRVAYRSQRWATVQLDLTRPDGVRTEAEPLQAVPLTPSASAQRTPGLRRSTFPPSGSARWWRSPRRSDCRTRALTMCGGPSRSSCTTSFTRTQ